jgi:hypothetical protein
LEDGKIGGLGDEGLMHREKNDDASERIICGPHADAVHDGQVYFLRAQ